jgi:hypothetical protein
MGAPRRTLVDHLVDDPKSRTILHVWAARAQGRRKIIFPQTLSMSLAHGSHGLANQIWSLVGYCVLAHLMSAELVLPTWDTNVDRARGKLEFGELFDAQHFERTMIVEGRHFPAVVTVAAEAERRRPLRDNRTATVRRSYIGWRIYKAMHSQTWRKRILLQFNSSGRTELEANAKIAEAESTLRRLEMGVYKALRAAPHIRAAALATDAAHAAAARGPFGCIHARVEHDMQIGWKINKAGPPPALSRYLGHAAVDHGARDTGLRKGVREDPKHGRAGQTASSLGEFAAVRRTPRAFISVGRDISPADAAMLGQRSAWGAKAVRTSAAGKSTWNGTDEAETQTGAGAGTGAGTGTGAGASQAVRNVSSYAAAALVDMEICRRAAWFAGWPGSSFARLLGAYRAIDHGQPEYFAVCPEFVVLYRGDPIGHHEFCLSD